MSHNKLFVMLFVLLTALLAACGSGETEPAATTTPEITQPPADTLTAEMPETDGAADAVIVAAKAHLARELGVAEAEIEVASAEATEFTDSCLGLGQLNESCLQAITPGWLIMLSAGGQEYELRTDEIGEQVRIAPQEAQSAADPEAATAAAVALLADELGVTAAEIELVSLEGAEFTDSCLGLGQANESCLQAITPGWLVMLGVEDQMYEVHTDETGQQARLAGEAE